MCYNLILSVTKNNSFMTSMPDLTPSSSSPSSVPVRPSRFGNLISVDIRQKLKKCDIIMLIVLKIDHYYLGQT
jgi:hypothetical protein